MRLLVLLSILFLASCGQKNSSVRSYSYVKIDEAVSESLINSYGLEDGQNQTIDKTIYNDESKAYFSLYSDGKIFYEIPGVGTGQGIWKKFSDYILIEAETGIFDFEVQLKKTSEGNYEFQYYDRFGFNIVPAYLKN